MERIEHVLDLGVSRLILGTAALRNWELVKMQLPSIRSRSRSESMPQKA